MKNFTTLNEVTSVILAAGDTRTKAKKPKAGQKWRDTKTGKLNPDLKTVAENLKTIGSKYGLGVIVPDDIIVIDIDKAKYVVAMDRYLLKSGIKTMTVKTKNGKHY